MRALVEEYRAKGSRGFSVKISVDPVIDAQRIQWFVVDANGGFTVEAALRMLRLLPDGLDFSFEAQCQTWRECLSLRRRTNVPIIHDELALTETSIIQITTDDASEGINFKVQKFRGLSKARRVRDLCIAVGYVMSVQETCGSILNSLRWFVWPRLFQEISSAVF